MAPNSLSVIETIAAQATAVGRGGVGIIRVSGPLTQRIAKTILGYLPKPRQADYKPFYDNQQQIIDIGLVLFFPGPHSFTGEDVVEFHCHGGAITLDRLLREIVFLGARVAKPGEFSERAFLNDKIDLTQAEAIADLIDAQSEQAAKLALNSLQGEFSKRVDELLNELIALRMYVEAAIDFPEEEIDFLSDRHIADNIQKLLVAIDKVLQSAHQGSLMRDGMTIVIVGKPNAGKSSLLNALVGKESAIVTDIPGTTRDVLREYIHIDGIPLHIIDTAGLRESDDVVEREGIKRALREIEKADQVLLVVDSSTNPNTQPDILWPQDIGCPLPKQKITVIQNKVDKVNMPCEEQSMDGYHRIALSAKTGQGIHLLRDYLKQCVGYSHQIEGQFIARRRHLEALNQAKKSIEIGYEQLKQHKAGELLAEDLRQAQMALGEITGRFTSDDLLGVIFSSFCIGK